MYMILEISEEHTDDTIKSNIPLSEYHPPILSFPHDDDLPNIENAYSEHPRSRELPQSDINVLRDKYLPSKSDSDFKKNPPLAFSNHPTLPWVKTLDISPTELPQELLSFIENEWKTVSSFSAIKTTEGITNHPHTDDGDIYFWWSGNLFVDVWKDYKDGDTTTKTTVPLWNNFVVTYPWETHGISSKTDNEELFFAVKFK